MYLDILTKRYGLRIYTHLVNTYFEAQSECVNYTPLACCHIVSV